MNSKEIKWGVINSLRVVRGDIVSFTYTNYRGETAKRNAQILGFSLGSTEWHPEPGMLMRAWDRDKEVERQFATKDISDVILLENKPVEDKAENNG